MTDEDWTGGGAAALGTYAPDVLATYAVLVSVRPSGVHDEMLEAPAVVAFAEEFRVDAGRIDGVVRAAFEHTTGDHATAVAEVVWISDVAPRVRCALDALFGPSVEWPGRRRYPVAHTRVAIDAFLESVTALVAVGHDESSDRPDAANAALALADSMIRTPSAIPASVVEAVRALLVPGEAVAVVLEGARRSARKLDAALAA
jgi:hypothetical protein